MRMNYLRNRLGRESVKTLLRACLHWKPLTDPRPGFSIVLGTPWDLRHLLAVNLKFVARTDTTSLHRIHVVFDRRPRPGADELIAEVRAAFPQLPLTFRFYPPFTGRIIERVNVSTFYNSMNTVLALGECETKYAILHDFDLYPLAPDYFTGIVEAMAQRQLRFSGRELTYFDGLTERDAVIGTWSLGIDVEWLRRRHHPVTCFHTTIPTAEGRWMSLDPYSHLQMQTPERDLAGPIDGLACHVRNLCSTYLRFTGGKHAKVAWRLHYLWYLEGLDSRPHRVAEVTEAMNNASDGRLTIDGLSADFSKVHAGSAGVLRSELRLMDRTLFGAPRPETEAYIDAFERFLRRYGINDAPGSTGEPAAEEEAGAEGRTHNHPASGASSIHPGGDGAAGHRNAAATAAAAAGRDR